LRRLGVDRHDVDFALDYAPRAEGDPRRVDAHGVTPRGNAATHAATYFLLADRQPSYAALMYVTHRWGDANRTLKEWIVRQFANLIERGGEWREETLYLLWVDFFEVPERARFVFPRLLKALEPRDWPEVIAASGPVPWDVKAGIYRGLVAEPAMQESLAKGICFSFHDVYGSADAIEARALYRRLTVADAEVKAALERVLGRPAPWRVRAVISVDQRDPRWSKWIPTTQRDEASFLILLQPLGAQDAWMKTAELILDHRRIATLAHWGFPFDRAIRHQVKGDWQDPEPNGSILFRALGSIGVARGAVGRVVEAWPAGLAIRLEE